MMKANTKKYLISITLIFSLLLIFSLILNILYYFDTISLSTIKYLKMFVSIIAFLLGGINIGKNSLNKGYIHGLKLSMIIVVLFLIFSLLFNNYKITLIIYYLITTFTITFGAMIGINKKIM